MKSYVISVSLGTGCYRHIRISAAATLYRLHKAILDAFEFEDDHAHAFFMDNKYWSNYAAFFSMKMRGDERLTKSRRLEKLGLIKGSQFKYLFDFGDEWRFQCKLLRELEEETAKPVVIRSVGASPVQYACFDAGEEWDDGEEDVHDFPELYPPEVCQKMLEELPLPPKTAARICKYFLAAARLYGILSVGTLYTLYSVENPEISEEDFLSVAEVLRHGYHMEYAILGCEVMYLDAPVAPPMEREIIAQHLWIDGPEAYYELVDQQANKPLKILPAEEFLLYADSGYYPKTAEHNKMLTYLKQRSKMLKVNPGELVMGIEDMITVDFRLQSIIDDLEREGLVFDSQNDIGEFVSLYQALNNTTRKHANRGYTPEELFFLSPRGQKLALRNAPEGQLSLFDEPVEKPKLTLVGKPSRNSPCPCGSGRKYKNCCGKTND